LSQKGPFLIHILGSPTYPGGANIAKFGISIEGISVIIYLKQS
jgi:hypothetical protein